MTKPAPKQKPKNPAPRRATTRVVTRTEEVDNDDELPEPEEEFLDPEEEALESIFAEARGHSGVEIRVYKLDPENRTGARAYAMSVSLEDADSGRLMETLQRKWKGGEFELVARAEGRILKRTTVNVLPPPEPEVPPPVQVQEQMAAVLKAAMEPMQQVIAEMRNKPQFNFNDLLTRGAMLLPLLQQARALLIPAVPAAVGNPSDPLTLLTQMRKMKETMDALGMSDREPDNLDRMISLFNNVAKPLMEKMEQAKLAQPQRPRAPAPSIPTAGTHPGIPVVMPNDSPVANAAAEIPEALLPYIPMLVVAARSGETAESIGERILQAIPDDVVDPLADALEDGSLVSALLAKPEFATNVPWVNALAKYILAALSSEEPVAEGGEDVSGASGENATD